MKILRRRDLERGGEALGGSVHYEDEVEFDQFSTDPNVGSRLMEIACEVLCDADYNWMLRYLSNHRGTPLPPQAAITWNRIKRIIKEATKDDAEFHRRLSEGGQ